MTRPEKRQADMLVRRMERLIRLRVEYRADINDRGTRLLDRSIRATVIDLTDYGQSEKAGELLHKLSVRLAAGGLL